MCFNLLANLEELRLRHTTNGSPVVLAVVVRRIDEGTTEAQVVGVRATILRRRPIGAVAALRVEPNVPVATALR